MKLINRVKGFDQGTKQNASQTNYAPSAALVAAEEQEKGPRCKARCGDARRRL